ncbi:MAG: arginase [Chloroflexota bacterium]
METKFKTLDQLIDHMMKLDDDPLYEGGTNMVICRGNPKARFMVVGEAPGPQENKEGRPFIGRSGQLLSELLQLAGLDSEQDVFITNSVFRMPPGKDGKAFRKPSKKEIDYYRQYLLEIIRLIDPLVMLLPGNVAMQAILGTTGITKLRGQWVEWESRQVLPIFHPAYLLRNPSAETRTIMEQDVQAAGRKYKALLGGDLSESIKPHPEAAPTSTKAETQAIRIIGVPMDLGQARRGVDMGPSALRYAGLGNRLRRLGHTIEDQGDIPTPVRDTLPPEGGLAFLPAVVESCEAIYQAGRAAIEAGSFPLFLGGDHSIAVGTVGGVTHTESTGLLWIDAHGDFNTPDTSPSGNVHGMPLAALLGHGDATLVNVGRPGQKLKTSDIVLLGIRDLDTQERILLKEQGVKVYTMREIDERGLAPVAREALEYLSHCERLHVSLDMDSLDPSEAPGVGTPVPGGLTYREAHLLMEIIADCACVTSADVVEINPILDDRNHTAELAVELMASLLGKSIL